jgi:Tfp pilus assembly protein PilF
MGKALNRKKLEKTTVAKGNIPEVTTISSKGTLPPWTGSVPLHIMLIIILGLLAYSNTFNVPFQWDDNSNIVENPIINDMGYFLEPAKAADFQKYTALNSRFVGYLTFALNYKLHGLDVLGYHVANLAIHMLNALLVYFLVVLTFRTPFINGTLLKKHDRHIALFSALLFVSHPMQTQAVTYIVQRFALLATMFYLLSLVAYIKSRLSSQKAARFSLYLLSLVSAVLAMKTKQIALTLPLTIALYEFFFFSEKTKRRLIYLVPLLLTMLIIPLTLIDVDRSLQEIKVDAGEKTELTNMPRLDYLLTEFRVIVTYLRLLVFPANQNLDYDYPLYNSFLEPPVFLSFLFLMSVLGLGVYCLVRSSELGVRSSLHHSSPITHHPSRLIAFGIFWFFLSLSVESSIIPLHVIYEHRVYLPSVGAFLALGTGAFLLMERVKEKATRKVVVSFLVFAPLVLSAATYARNTVWKSDISLWEDVVIKSPQKARGHYNLGGAYESNNLIDKAIEQYRIAVRLKPDLEVAHNNLGTAYRAKGFIDKAIEQYRIALKLTPGYAEAHNNLGNAYLSKGLTDKAIGEYRIAVRLKLDFADAHFNLGVSYLEKGFREKARREFEATLRINPDDHEARRNLNRIDKMQRK